MFSQHWESFSQINQMLFYLLAFNYHIINVCFHVPLNLPFKHLCYHSLINGSCVFEAEGHCMIMIVPIRGTKGRLLLVGQ